MEDAVGQAAELRGDTRPTGATRDSTPTEWLDFVERYAHGNYEPARPPQKPASDLALAQQLASIDLTHAEPRLVEVARVLKTYVQKGYLPAPRSSDMQSRMTAIQTYDLDDPARRSSIDRCVSIAQRYFNVDSVAVMLQTQRDILVLAEANAPVPAGTFGPRDSMFCSHTALRNDDELVVVHSAEDWRFAKNPLVRGDGSVQHYAGQPIRLRVSKTGDDDAHAELTTVGSLCLLEHTTQGSVIRNLSSEDKEFLRDLAYLVASELEHGRLARDSARAISLTGLLNPPPAYLPARTASQSAPSLQRPDSAEHATSAAIDQQAEEADILTRSATDLLRLLKADGVAIVDIRGYHVSTVTRSGTSRATSELSHDHPESNPASATVSSPSVGHHMPILSTTEGSNTPTTTSPSGASTRERYRELTAPDGTTLSWFEPKAGKADQTKSRSRSLPTLAHAQIGLPDDWLHFGSRAVAQVLFKHCMGEQNIAFSRAGSESPAAAFELVPDVTEAVIALPLFDSRKQPHLLVLVARSKLDRPFDQTEEGFARAIGAICVANFERLRAIDAVQGQAFFLSQISHEFRVPLHSILCQVECMREIFDPDTAMQSHMRQEVLQMLDSVEAAGLTLRDTLEDVLEYGKLSSHRSTVADHDKTQVYQTLELGPELFDIVQQGIDRKKHSNLLAEGERELPNVTVDVDPRLSAFHVYLNTTAFRRIVLNVLSNALNFTHTGEIKLLLRAHAPAAPASSAIDLTVQDTGKGMSQEFVSTRAYFEPFKQEDPFTSGSGLGMSVVNNLLQRLHGSCEVSSTLGIGTTVKLRIPVKFEKLSHSARESDPSAAKLVRVYTGSIAVPMSLGLPTSPGQPLTPSTEESASQASRKRPSPSEGSSNGQSSPHKAAKNARASALRVMVAEDNAVSRNILVSLLKRNKVSYVAVADGLQAVAAYKQFLPHLFWADVNMPIKTGIEAAAEIRAYERQESLAPCRIVAISGSNEAESSHAGMLGESRFDEYLIKGTVKLKQLENSLLALKEQLSL
ncbi:uncharacterized protein L969DRAFT_74384 [Mixia osmundae IAM 14324]|uniref:histidine kinase n=1 Tax=Mixia osmundae (strain CBS 9802 / IAM 14324 / JCM 22182 / KY 12970) TaxID=764103 RepID=G7E3C9_MIXOS|nr:uncharacterized protein L969DRAFT_74384 [Mixia osmundae IAM 14324]KEI39325.1 hypothetical protein L969DRAFT_74384 [Mixia osmundae IAM 14324]GAA97339.1 hypothetical protein E5Q_04017 [Mixia osmundae IAM 14324]